MCIEIYDSTVNFTECFENPTMQAVIPFGTKCKSLWIV